MLVTVGVPFFNAEASLANAIRSVFLQPFKDWELILMDDGSTDRGVEFARSICDTRVRVYSDGRNLKVTARRNEIVQLARGKYLAWLDADDMMHPDRLERQTQFLEREPSVDLLGSSKYILDASGRVVGKRYAWAGAEPSCRPSEAALWQPTVMGRSEWFRKNLQDSSLERAADMELWLRTAPYSQFRNIPEALCFYAELGTFSPQKYRRSWRCARSVIRRHGPKLVGRWNSQMEILKGYLKVALLSGAYYCGAHERLLRRRNTPISEEERAAAEAILTRVRQVKLPHGPACV